ncbi:MAG: LuxR C-terminal-related transcriptional regulator [Paracoccaceae bacterium]
MADDTLWPDLLQRIAEQVHAFGCIVFEWQGNPGSRRIVPTLESSVHEHETVLTYLEKCRDTETEDQNIFEAHSLVADGVDLIEDDVLAPSLSALKQRKNVIALQRMGILHRAAGLLSKDNPTVSRFSIQLGHDRGRFNAEEKHYLSGVLPHIAKALELGRPAKQLATINQTLLASINQLMIGVCILDSAGRKIVTNQEFDRQCAEHRVFAIGRDGVLAFSRPEDQRRFNVQTDDVFNHGKFGARPRKEAISIGDQSFLCVELVPLRDFDELGSGLFGGFVLYSMDTSRPLSFNSAQIVDTYDLTQAELAVLALVAEGLTNAEISERRDRSVATINAQVKSILSKTQCSTRTQLVRLMSSFEGRFVAPTSE